jgi:hypothetical protein
MHSAKFPIPPRGRSRTSEHSSKKKSPIAPPASLPQPPPPKLSAPPHSPTKQISPKLPSANSNDISPPLPPTGEARTLFAKTKTDESAFRQQIQTELRESDPGRLDALYRTALARSTTLAQLADERRTLFILLLSRVAAAGGAELLTATLADAPDLQAEIQLDELRGLLAFAALTGGKPLPDYAITTANASPPAARNSLPQMLVELGRAAEAAAALEASNPTDALRWIEQGTESLPAVRSALAAEFSSRISSSTDAPTTLTAVAACKNGLWREECLEIAGRNLADRKLAAEINQWASSSRIPPQEHIALLYGASLSQLLNLSKPAPTQP